MSSLELVSSGIVMGIVHVLAGPDHLSALATLSANIGNFKAFGLGLRWGMGHAVGLIVVATILIALSEGGEVTESHIFSSVCEFIVGIFMIALGTYGLYSTYRKTTIDSEDGPQETFTEMKQLDNLPSEELPIHNAEVSLDLLPPPTLDHHQTKFPKSIAICLEKTCVLAPNCCQNLLNESNATNVVSFGIGIVHGIAGPGGVLGVIPAVQLHDAKLATLYLGTFCSTSILVMGLFAALYGSCTNRLGEATDMEIPLSIFSAVLSLFVGVLWIILILTGKMDEVFGHG